MFDCFTGFDNNGGLCQCPTTPSLTYPTTATPATCDICSNVINGCTTCSYTSPTTQCTACLGNYYPVTAYPTTTCSACPIYCTSCTSYTFCLGCAPGMLSPPTAGQCFCPSPNYIDPVTLTCVACNLAIANCLTCASTIPTTCTSSIPGTYISPDQTQVIACPMNCATCDSTGCLTPNPGYTLVNPTTITCDTACTTCLAGSIPYCTDCIAGGTCGGCQNGYYLLNSLTCSPCPTANCQQCTNAGTCLSCSSTFTLTASLQCVCNHTAGLYLDNSGQCSACSIAVTGCSTCVNTIPTTCTLCGDGYYWSTSTQCLPCGFPCKTCSGPLTNNCLSCLGTYVLTSSPATN